MAGSRFFRTRASRGRAPAFVAVASLACAVWTASCATHDLLVGDDSVPDVDASLAAEASPLIDASSPIDSADIDADRPCSLSATENARAHLQLAIAAATARIQDQGAACDDTEEKTMVGLASRALAAVEACPAFRDIIATAAETKPLRDAMAGNLALVFLSGRFDAVDDQGQVVMNVVAPVLDGVTLWGPAPGAYGNMSKLRFGTGDQAVLSWLDIEATPIDWVDTNVTFAIGGTNAKGVEITITDDSGTAKVYRLEPGFESVFDFRLVPDDPDNFEIFTAMPSECSA